MEMAALHITPQPPFKGEKRAKQRNAGSEDDCRVRAMLFIRAPAAEKEMVRVEP